MSDGWYAEPAGKLKSGIYRRCDVAAKPAARMMQRNYLEVHQH
jgi:hypothetical protein